MHVKIGITAHLSARRWDNGEESEGLIGVFGVSIDALFHKVRLRGEGQNVHRAEILQLCQRRIMICRRPDQGELFQRGDAHRAALLRFAILERVTALVCSSLR